TPSHQDHSALPVAHHGADALLVAHQNHSALLAHHGADALPVAHQDHPALLVAHHPALLATPSHQDPGALLVAHHGAGYSGLSFACLAGEVHNRHHARRAGRARDGCAAAW
ncbi:hypothetical protein K525DRAFT_275682, partial [Schizophyllum commune Loenen D]